MTDIELHNDHAALTLFLDGPSWQGLRTATIGRMQCQDADAGAALIAQAMQAAQDASHEAVIGPMDGDTWHSYRLVTESDGSPPFALEPPHDPTAKAAFEAAGFAPIAGYFSAKLALDQAQTPTLPPIEGVDIRPWDGQDSAGLLADIHALTLHCFADNMLFQPITQEAFAALYAPVMPLIRPEFLYQSRDAAGQLQGYLLAYPHYAEAPDIKTLIIKSYASARPGLGRAMVTQAYRSARQAGFEHCIHALIHDNALSAKRSAAEGAVPFRRYALLGRRLDGQHS